MGTSVMNELSVLITGASSGIGKACTHLLSRNGFCVFAGVRSKNDGDILLEETSGNVKPLILDVTNQETINDAIGVILESTKSNLFALLNNAGIAFGGPLEMLSLSDIQKLIDVNVVGVFAVTQACIPLLRNQGGGRIINMGSMASFFAFPGFSAYSSSKHALRAITDSLRVELTQFNILVSIIEVGSVETPIWSKGLIFADKTLSEASDQIIKLYSPLIASLKKYSQNPKDIPPSTVAKKVFTILTSRKPKNSYLIGKDALALKLIGKLPDVLRDRIVSLFLQ